MKVKGNGQIHGMHGIVVGKGAVATVFSSLDFQ